MKAMEGLNKLKKGHRNILRSSQIDSHIEEGVKDGCIYQKYQSSERNIQPSLEKKTKFMAQEIFFF